MEALLLHDSTSGPASRSCPTFSLYSYFLNHGQLSQHKLNKPFPPSELLLVMCVCWGWVFEFKHNSRNRLVCLLSLSFFTLLDHLTLSVNFNCCLDFSSLVFQDLLWSFFLLYLLRFVPRKRGHSGARFHLFIK